MFSFIASVVFITLMLPSWFSITFNILAIRIVENQFNILPLFSIREVDIWISDLILLVVAFKVFCRAFLVKRFTNLIRSSFFPGLVAFIFVMIFSTLFSYSRYGYEVFRMELIPFLRFIGFQIGGFILFVASLNNRKQIQWAQNTISWIGYFAAATIYLGLILYPLGLKIGEINISEEFIRYQGIIGDSVKLFLLPFIFYEFFCKRYVNVALFLVALMLTGGRIGFIGLLVGLTVVAIIERKRFLSFRSFHNFASVFIILFICLWFDIGGMISRFMNPFSMDVGLQIRLTTWMTVLKMLPENMLTGFGFGGYRIFYHDYPIQAPWSLFSFSSDVYSQMLKSLLEGGILGLGAFLWLMLDVIKIFKKSMDRTNGDLYNFLKSGYIFSITLLIISPITSWILPASNVNYLFFMFIGISIGATRVNREEFEVNWNRRLPLLRAIEK